MITVQTLMARLVLVRYAIKFVNVCMLEWCKFFTEKHNHYEDMSVPKCRLA